MFACVVESIEGLLPSAALRVAAAVLEFPNGLVAVLIQLPKEIVHTSAELWLGRVAIVAAAH